MKSFGSKISRFIEQVSPWIVLAVIAFFTYVKFFAYPYAGFRWDTSGKVVYIFTEGNKDNPLKINDLLLQVDSVKWTDYIQDLRQPLFNYHQKGQVVQLQLERDGQELVIPWAAPGPNLTEIVDLIMTSGWFGFVFWFLGTLTFFRFQPHDERWKLFVAFNFLTAIWLTVGSGLSILHIWETAIILRVFVWISVPVYLHLHWIFPRSLGKLPKAVIWSIYLGTAIVVVAQIFQTIPQSFYYLGFILSIIGSVGLLIVHAIHQNESRNEIRALIIVAVISFVPTVMIGLLGSFVKLDAGVTELGVISLPLLPLAYFYAALRRQLGGVELSFNRFFFHYVFAILLLTVLLPVLVLLNRWITISNSAIPIGLIVMLVTAGSAILGYRRAQIFFERFILGVSLPPQNLLEIFSERITTSTSFSSLNRVLETEILPHLHIKEFAFLQIEKEENRLLMALGVDADGIVNQNPLTLSKELAGKFRLVEVNGPGTPFAWLRLSLELKVAGELVGLWLFGRRDPEDYYSQVEINLLKSLANQTAIAISNIMQTQRVLEMYQQDINRHEQERNRLAMDLHDSILNQMAAVVLSLDDNSITPKFQAAYDELTSQIREIIYDLRPAMLNYGLKPALEEFVESLEERDKNGLEIILELEPGDNRYPANVELQLFRIIQEACENSLRHGKARMIMICGALKPTEIDLSIADNGAGFSMDKGFELDALLANRHYGLAGMLERARLIGGNVKINSSLTGGTQISFRWMSPATKL